MPELPEVETVARGLQKKSINKKITRVEVRAAKIVYPSKDVFIKKLIGNKIIRVRRRAKMLIFDLADKTFMVGHLKMTGQLVYRQRTGQLIMGGHPLKDGEKDLPNKFSHVVFSFSDGSNLFFNDQRKFGWLKVVDVVGLQQELLKYGIEPLSRKFTVQKSQELLEKYPRKKIKQFLMDQTIIAGIGNIYADESCFYAGILPTRKVEKISLIEQKKLYRGIKQILIKAINKTGTSVENYVKADGDAGGYAKYLKVYGKNGKKCSRCGEIIKKIKLNGRGTHFCPGCQI